MNLLIKGTPDDARFMARRFGIERELCVLRTNTREHAIHETFAFIPDTQWRAVMAWFNATDKQEMIDGYGYPIGALLYYNYDRYPCCGAENYEGHLANVDTGACSSAKLHDVQKRAKAVSK